MRRSSSWRVWVSRGPLSSLPRWVPWSRPGVVGSRAAHARSRSDAVGALDVAGYGRMIRPRGWGGRFCVVAGSMVYGRGSSRIDGGVLVDAGCGAEGSQAYLWPSDTCRWCVCDMMIDWVTPRLRGCGRSVS
jgi:hypothetical protein